jgi:hypothetical protein
VSGAASSQSHHRWVLPWNPRASSDLLLILRNSTRVEVGLARGGSRLRRDFGGQAWDGADPSYKFLSVRSNNRLGVGGLIVLCWGNVAKVD